VCLILTTLLDQAIVGAKQPSEIGLRVSIGSASASEIKLSFRLTFESTTATEEHLNSVFRVRRNNKKLSTVEELSNICEHQGTSIATVDIHLLTLKAEFTELVVDD
jgi:hypothetical protein